MMRIDLTCPVEAWRSTLPTEETPSCEVTLFNLSSLQVVSVEITLLLSTGDEEETAKIIHRSRGLNGAPGKTFRMTVPVEGHITPTRYEITVEKVWFDNSSVWRREKENTISYEPNVLHRSAQLSALRSIAGEMASGYPVQRKGLWLCVCGRPNPDDAALCARCHREKAEVFANFSREAIDRIIAAKEDELAQLGRETLRKTSRKFADEKDFVRRRGRHGWIGKSAAALAIVAALGFAGWTWGVPHVKYQLASRAYQEGKYQEAAQQFSALGEYEDASALARQSALISEYRALKGRNTLNDAEYAAHTETLEGLGETVADVDGMYVSASQLRRDCGWKYAEHLYKENRLDEAEAMYHALGDSYEAPERLTEIAYLCACADLKNGDWSAAREGFTALLDYKDSAKLRLDTWYIPAVSAMESGDTATALSLLAEIPGHRDADTLILQIHYEAGAELRAEGRINEAAEEFHLARGYQDAEDQANECFYGPASVAWETMEYEQAAALFAKIPGYRDADEKWRLSLIEAAKIAIGQINYKKALTYLTQLPAEDEEAAALMKDCTYYPAVNAAKRGDYEEAAKLFAQIPGHRDADEQLLQAQFDWAGQLYGAGEYGKSAEIYTALGEYGGAQDKLNGVRYAQAEAALAAGDTLSIDEAIRLFTGLGEYAESPARLQLATWQKAAILLEKGDHESARALYTSLGEYPGAQEQLLACDYAAASALADAGRLAEALAAFEALGEYADAPAKCQALRYQQALTLAVTDPQGALALLDAMDEHPGAADQAKEIRYQQAEALLPGDRDGAIAAFRALGDYADASQRADMLSYEAALDLLDTDRAGAIEALLALSGYQPAMDKANALRYEDAAALTDWEKAAAAFDEIASYKDSASRANQLRYDAALAFADAGEWDRAEAAFAAMNGELDADEAVNELRYEAAEDLLKAGKKDTAAAAFEAIAEYMDAAERAKAIRYETAQALIKSDPEAAAAAFARLGDYKDAAERANAIRYEAAKALSAADWEKAADAFDALGDYEDASAQASALRYNAAAAKAAAGDYEGASAMFAALGDYSDSASMALQVRYDAAAKMAARGEWDAAVALYTELGDFADCRERISLTRYAEAESAENAEDFLKAAKLYAALGGFQDANTKADEMYHKYYSGPMEAMKSASEKGNHQEVLQIMSWLDVTELPAKYQEMTKLHQAALYAEGNRLFDEGKPYEAYGYYKQLPANYRAMADRLQRPCYLILGAWEDKDGNRYIFRGEGVCNLNGEVLCFTVKGTDMFTGAAADELTKSHRINSVTRNNAWLYDERGEKDVSIRLTRVKED